MRHTVAGMWVVLSLFAPFQAKAAKELDEWAAKCFADYEDFRAKWAPVEQSARAELKAVEGQAFYEAFPRLRVLYLGLQDQAKKLGFTEGISRYQAQDDGVAFEVAQAVMALLARTGHDLFQIFKFDDFKNGHPNTGDAAFDRNHFCRRGYSLGTHRTPPFRYDREERRINSGWLPPEESAAFYKREVEHFERAKEAFRITRVDAQKAKHEDGYVTGVQKTAAGLVFGIAHVDKPYSCHLSKRILRVHPNGFVDYDSDCTFSDKEVTLYKAKVTFKDPTLPNVRKGDFISYYGMATTGGEHQLDGVHLTYIIRGKKEVGNWHFSEFKRK